MEQIKLILQLYYRPASATSEILDKGSWFFAAAAVLIVSAAFFFTVNANLDTAYRIPNLYEFYQPDYAADSMIVDAEYENSLTEYQKELAKRSKIPLVGNHFFKFFSFEPTGFYQPILSLSIFYVPFAILLMSIFGAAGNVGMLIQRSYGELATCALLSWTAAHLPFAILGIALYQTAIPPQIYFAMWLVSGILFGVFMMFALRTVFGASFATAILVVCLAWISLSAGMYIFRYVSPWLFSPFLLFFGYMYFGGAISGGVRGAGDAFRQKQNFKRFLHNATVNPKDADAHVQLGLIYLQRKQETKALEHFTKAFEIDKTEVDANYELGKLARSRSDLQLALNHFSTVVEQNDKHALSEIWREIGATYLEAQMLEPAREALEKFIERRPVDAEGLYYLGKVFNARGENEKAREIFEQAIEAAVKSPDFRRRGLQRWKKLAQKEL